MSPTDDLYGKIYLPSFRALFVPAAGRERANSRSARFWLLIKAEFEDDYRQLLEQRSVVEHDDLRTLASFRALQAAAQTRKKTWPTPECPPDVERWIAWLAAPDSSMESHLASCSPCRKLAESRRGRPKVRSDLRSRRSMTTRARKKPQTRSLPLPSLRPLVATVSKVSLPQRRFLVAALGLAIVGLIATLWWQGWLGRGSTAEASEQGHVAAHDSDVHSSAPPDPAEDDGSTSAPNQDEPKTESTDTESPEGSEAPEEGTRQPSLPANFDPAQWQCLDEIHGRPLRGTLLRIAPLESDEILAVGFRDESGQEYHPIGIADLLEGAGESALRFRPRTLPWLGSWTDEFDHSTIDVDLTVTEAVFDDQNQTLLLPDPTTPLEDIVITTEARGYVAGTWSLSELASSPDRIPLQRTHHNLVIAIADTRTTRAALGDQPFARLDQLAQTLHQTLAALPKHAGVQKIDAILVGDHGVRRVNDLGTQSVPASFLAADKPESILGTDPRPSDYSMIHDPELVELMGPHTVVLAIVGDLAPPREDCARSAVRPVRHVHLAKLRVPHDEAAWQWCIRNSDGQSSLDATTPETLTESLRQLALDLQEKLSPPDTPRGG